MEQKNVEDEVGFILEISAQLQLFLNFYEAGMKQVVTKLEILCKDFQYEKKHKPIENIKYRIKEPKSILNKIRKKNLPFTYRAMSENIFDIAGIRVLCPFISDVYGIADLLCSQEDITLIETKDYIEHPKDNGYRSLHLIVSTPVNFSDCKRDIIIEIQLRTVGMDSWASLEHQLCYKKSSGITTDILSELRKCADAIADNDNKMQRIASNLALFTRDECISVDCKSNSEILFLTPNIEGNE
ncbi:GTP pyrophosphokinase [Anaerocolumna jejuensis]|uniref:GTP pyrophosphokinase n=1 Tax=Anaerocolumna jejuensis TaxID=259063 RepID=UPI003F7CC339